MAKIQSFADKVAKGTIDYSRHCPKCEEAYTMIKLVTAEKMADTNAHKFKERMVAVCKCNENEITA